MADQAPADHRPEASGRGPGHSLPWRVSAQWGGIFVAAALGATGLLFGWQASSLDLGGLGLPGPGFLPMLLGGLVTVFAIAIALASWRTPTQRPPVELGHPPVLIAFGALLMVPLLFEPLGAYVTLGLLSAALLVFIARLSPLLAGLWTTLGMVVCWGLFQTLLGMRLPMGPF